MTDDVDAFEDAGAGGDAEASGDAGTVEEAENRKVVDDVDASEDAEDVDAFEDAEDFDPVGTAALIVIYMAIVVGMWVFTYFVEFLGRGVSIVG